MDIKIIKDIISLAKEEGVAELKCESNEMKISVKLIGESNFFTPSLQPAQVAAVQTTAAVENKDEGLVSVLSPFVGTFYAAASPGKPNFANIGEKVNKGSILCILEAMKIMNEIESEYSGEIVEICVENESLVEFGQPLFKIRVN